WCSGIPHRTPTTTAPRRATAAGTGCTEAAHAARDLQAMDAAAALYEPINTLKPVASGLWIVDGTIVRMAALGGSAPFTTRMTVARLADGSLWCHSPIAPDAALCRAIEEVVFLHRASATLILADLIENFEAAKLGTAMRWIARLGGVLDPDGK